MKEEIEREKMSLKTEVIRLDKSVIKQGGWW